MVCHLSVQGAKVTWNVAHDHYSHIKAYLPWVIPALLVTARCQPLTRWTAVKNPRW